MAKYSTTSLSMNEADEEKLKKLKKNGHKVINVFRAGLNVLLNGSKTASNGSKNDYRG